jgi:hypothetical protein
MTVLTATSTLNALPGINFGLIISRSPSQAIGQMLIERPGTLKSILILSGNGACCEFIENILPWTTKALQHFRFRYIVDFSVTDKVIQKAEFLLTEKWKKNAYSSNFQIC